jgi:hypothetical protein
MLAQSTRASGSMQEDDSNGPALSQEAERRREAQRRRLAEALRENLQKRKQQTRGRSEPAD